MTVFVVAVVSAEVSCHVIKCIGPYVAERFTELLSQKYNDTAYNWYNVTTLYVPRSRARYDDWKFGMLRHFAARRKLAEHLRCATSVTIMIAVALTMEWPDFARGRRS